MSRWKNRTYGAIRPFEQTDQWIALYHSHGEPAPWLRARKDGRDVTTLPVSQWSDYDQSAYARGWRPDRFGDPEDTVPEESAVLVKLD